MVILALLVILLALVFGLGVLLTGGDDPATLRFFDVINVSATSAGVFAAGAITTVVLLAGIFLLQDGLRRARRKRSEVKSLRSRAERAPARGDTPTQSSPTQSTRERSRSTDPERP